MLTRLIERTETVSEGSIEYAYEYRVAEYEYEEMPEQENSPEPISTPNRVNNLTQLSLHPKARQLWPTSRITPPVESSFCTLSCKPFFKANNPQRTGFVDSPIKTQLAEKATYLTANLASP